MRKQITKSALLMAVMAGALTFNACKNEEPNPGVDLNGPKSNVTVGMTLAKKASAPKMMSKSAISGDDLNMGSAIQDVKNVVIVPMVKGAKLQPIKLGTYVSGTTTTHYRTATILQTTDEFRVYGNMPEAWYNAMDTNAVFSIAASYLTIAESVETNKPTVGTYYAPHPLYYYVDALGSTNGFQVAQGLTPGDWETASYGNPANGQVGDNNRVKIKGVNYAVGALVAGVRAALTTEAADKDMFYSVTGVEDDACSWNELATNGGTQQMDITGVVIAGQTKTFTETFTRSGSEVVPVYAAANNVTMKDAALNFETGSSAKVLNANIYSTVAPEDGQTVLLNFQFQNKTGKYFKTNDGVEIAPDGYFYLQASISKTDKDIFAADFTTLVNGKVTDWGKASSTVVESTEVEIGIEIDTDWQQGTDYEVEM